MQPIVEQFGGEVVELKDAEVRYRAKRKSVPETASVQKEHQPTVVSSTDGTKVVKRLDKTIVEEIEGVGKYRWTYRAHVCSAA